MYIYLFTHNKENETRKMKQKPEWQGRDNFLCTLASEVRIGRAKMRIML